MPRKKIKYFHKHKPKKKVEKTRERTDDRVLFLAYLSLAFALVVFFVAYTALNPN